MIRRCLFYDIFLYVAKILVLIFFNEREIQKSNCYHKQGHGAACEYGDTLHMLQFGAAQVLLSQLPDFNSIKFLSVVAAVMSFTYSFIGFALGFAEVIGWMVNQLQISCLFIGFPYVYHIIFTSLQNYRKWICQG